MIKIIAFAALAVLAGCAHAQNLAPGETGPPEPYAYRYETDTHAASEEKDPSGRVTGFYTIVGDDGRQRRVEYVADEAGFRAKVLTNEVGTKSENSADVEINASQPNPEQLILYQRQQPQVQQTQQLVQPLQIKNVQQTVTSSPIAPAFQQQQVRYTNQISRYGNGIYSYGYAPNTNYVYGGPSSYRTGYAGYSGPIAQNANQGSYNLHLPSSYYNAYNSGYSYGQPGYITRYSSGSVSPLTNSNIAYRNYGYSTSAPNLVNGQAGSLVGSSNYIVLKKK